MSEPIEVIRGVLERAGFEPRTKGSGFKARCPGHDDRNPSLCVDRGDDGRALVRCQAGCKTADVLAAIGLKMSDLYPGEPERNGTASKAKPKTPSKVYATPEEAWAALRLGTPAGTWTYRNSGGDVAMKIARFETEGGKTFRPIHPTPEGWKFGDPDGLLPLYRLPELAGATRVYVTEGEKAADAAECLGVVTTTSAHGAASPGKTDWSPLAGREVVILPDADAPGEGYASTVIGLLAKLDPAPKVKVVRLPGLPAGGDIVEWVASLPAGWTEASARAELERLADAAAPIEDQDKAETESPDPEKKPKNREPGEAQAQVLLKLAQPATLFHASDGRTFATVPVDHHHETHAINSSSFKRWITRSYYQAKGGPPSADALKAALSVLEAQAQFDGPTQEVAVRVAGDQVDDAPAYYLDLCDQQWRAVRVNRDGWQVIDQPPVRFRRAKGMKPLPTPEPGGRVDDLRAFINVGSDADWMLVVAWLTAALRPEGPYPGLAVTGQQGSAKSTMARVLRRAIDPHATLLRSEPKEPRDLMIGATNAWMITLDNLSGLYPWLSDCLCRLATGGGFATRTLYENDEETFFDAMRPILLNGIEDVASRPDLLDRCITLNLPAIPEEARREESPFWREFEGAHPKILGALLDAVAGGLKHLPDVQLDRRPRMADFARWGAAVGRALGWADGAFLTAYADNRSSAHVAAVEASPVATAIRELLDKAPTWEGSAAKLLETLSELAGEKVARGKGWPTSPRSMAGTLQRIQPALEGVGIAVDTRRACDRKRSRIITLTRHQEEAERSSASSAPSGRQATQDVTAIPQRQMRLGKVVDDVADGRKTAPGEIVRNDSCQRTVDDPNDPSALQPSATSSANGVGRKPIARHKVASSSRVASDGADGADDLSPTLEATPREVYEL